MLMLVKMVMMTMMIMVERSNVVKKVHMSNSTIIMRNIIIRKKTSPYKSRINDYTPMTSRSSLSLTKFA